LGYIATDVYARYKRMTGFNVLHALGYDSFGLPAEQHAIATGVHPRVNTESNVANMRRQLRRLGLGHDARRSVSTTDEDFYRWTQWIFLQVYNSWYDERIGKARPVSELENAYADGSIATPSGDAWSDMSAAQRRDAVDARRLAYLSHAPVNWCPGLGTILANEEVTAEGRSDIGNYPVFKKNMRQWMMRITSYADRLLDDLDRLDWPEPIKLMQRNWIGRSEGAEVDFQVDGQPEKIRVFTTRPDTLFGATYMVLSPEHRLVAGLTTPAQSAAVKQYQEFAATKSDLERTELAKDKTGVWTGAFAINPVTGGQIPIWIADYVLASYGTGAIMAVPAHDERDFEFAQKFGLPVVQVVQPPDAKTEWQGFCDEGTAVNSSNAEIALDGLPTAEAKQQITVWLESKGLGQKTVNFKLRDWLFSRQRYWGEPFPILWRKDADGNLYHEALPETALPLMPPTLEDYKPTADGQPPLARAQDWLHLPDGAIRETNTMPQWAGSCWYYLRYLDAKNAQGFVGREVENYWMKSGGKTPGVDLYVGGTEHAVLHLLYARFWHKVLFDLGQVSTAEPFFKLVNQGLILGEDGQKMSKSRGNVVNPDDVLVEYGADAFRLYEMFMGPLQDTKPWNTQGVEGVYRFLGRVWRLFVDEKAETDYEQASTVASGTDSAAESARLLDLIRLSPLIRDDAPTPAQLKLLHECIRKVTHDLEHLQFNTAISAMMVFINGAMTWENRPSTVLGSFLQLLAPFSPHLAEELWQRLHQHRDAAVPSLTYAPWPAFDPALLVETDMELPVQVNGKLRDVIRMPVDATAAEIEAAALKAEKAQQFIVGKTVKKVIVVPRKMVNVVVA
jgi:leucyl-tRNA synthetase